MQIIRNTIDNNLNVVYNNSMAISFLEVVVLKELSCIRKKLNMSQKELADKLGVTQGAISQWENGIKHAFALALGCARLFHRLADDLIRPQDRGCAYFGTCIVDVAKCWFPSPPFPPFNTICLRLSPDISRCV